MNLLPSFQGSAANLSEQSSGDEGEWSGRVLHVLHQESDD